MQILRPLEKAKGCKNDAKGAKTTRKGCKNDIPLHPPCREPVKGTSERTGEVTEGAKTPPRTNKKSADEPKPTTETWTAYASAYQIRYGVPPVRNATVSGQLANFVKRIGRAESQRSPRTT